MAALNGLDHHGGDLAAVCADVFQCRVGAVLQDHYIAGASRHDSGSDGGSAMRRRSQQNLVEGAVVVASEVDNLVACGDSAGNAHRRHHRLRAGVAESGALHAG